MHWQGRGVCAKPPNGKGSLQGRRSSRERALVHPRSGTYVRERQPTRAPCTYADDTFARARSNLSAAALKETSPVLFKICSECLLMVAIAHPRFSAIA